MCSVASTKFHGFIMVLNIANINNPFFNKINMCKTFNCFRISTESTFIASDISQKYLIGITLFCWIFTVPERYLYKAQLVGYSLVSHAYTTLIDNLNFISTLAIQAVLEMKWKVCSDMHTQQTCVYAPKINMRHIVRSNFSTVN